MEPPPWPTPEGQGIPYVFDQVSLASLVKTTATRRARFRFPEDPPSRQETARREETPQGAATPAQQAGDDDDDDLDVDEDV
jgi:hypothetical protein